MHETHRDSAASGDGGRNSGHPLTVCRSRDYVLSGQPKPGLEGEIKTNARLLRLAQFEWFGYPALK